ncbi:MAG: hypothetical protein RL326_2165 [Pseudomonadota bacterium]
MPLYDNPAESLPLRVEPTMKVVTRRDFSRKSISKQKVRSFYGG